MSISMRLAIPAPAAATAAPPRLRVRAAGNWARLPAARVALRMETGALRGCASLPLKPQPLGTGAGQPSRRRGAAAVCHSSAYLSAQTMQWISAGASAGEYGQWTAFLALLVRLFFFIPGRYVE
nr:unnamed protein product [Digitaria exilis]